jgi:hypothetical protein
MYLYTSDYDAATPSAFLLQGLPDDITSDAKKNGNTTTSKTTHDVGTSLFNLMVVNALVYKCADYLGIESLKMLAVERYLTDAETNFS